MSLVQQMALYVPRSTGGALCALLRHHRDSLFYVIYLIIGIPLGIPLLRHICYCTKGNPHLHHIRYCLNGGVWHHRMWRHVPESVPSTGIMTFTILLTGSTTETLYHLWPSLILPEKGTAAQIVIPSSKRYIPWARGSNVIPTRSLIAVACTAIAPPVDT